MRIIAIVNQKGGCGKTTTAVSLSAVMAMRGFRTLLVDLDPQSHCALGLGIPQTGIERTVLDALVADGTGFERHDYIQPVTRRLDLLPSTVRLAGVDVPGGALAGLPDRDRRLEHLLNRMESHYDVCLIDCPPTLNLLTYSAMRAAREVLVPVETSFYALRGATEQYHAIRSVIERIKRPIACHMLPTLHRPESKVSMEILQALKRDFPQLILPIEICFHEELREAASQGAPITEHAPDSPACRDYTALAEWLDEHAAPNVEVEVVWNQQQVAGARRPVGAPTMPIAGAARPANSRASELAERLRTHATPPGQGRPGEHHPDARPAAAATPARPGQEAGRAGDEHGRGRTPVRPGDVPGRATTGPGQDAGRRDERGFDRSSRASARIEPPRASYRVDALDDEVGERLLGATFTSRGVLFVQPLDCGTHVSVVGDFNGWSPSRHVMLRNEEAGVLEVLVPIEPGRHRYRLVVDGRWQPDAYNEAREVGAEGVVHSVVEVVERMDVAG